MTRSMVITKDHIILRRRSIAYFAGFAVFLAILACNMASGEQATPTPTVTAGSTPAAQVCGDGVCTSPEDAASCPADCVAPTAASTPAPEGPRVKTTQEVRVRFGPSIYCTVLGSYPKDSEIGVLAKSPDGLWWQVPFGNGVGWLSIPYTSPVTDLSAVQTLPGPYCAPPTNTPVPPTQTPLPPTITPTLAAVCGNGVIETGEECDTADTCSGLSFCNSSCQCKLPVIVTLKPPIITIPPIILTPIIIGP